MTSTKVIIKLIRMNCAINEQLMLVLKPFGISIQQFNVLRILRGQKGVAANLFTVQEKMVNKMSNTSRLVDKLIEKDLVERKICEENRRKIELFITSKGLSLLKKLDPLIDNEEEKMTQNLTVKDRNQLMALLEKLNVN
jgi:DNA-binding MarR family transcriptional regulator